MDIEKYAGKRFTLLLTDELDESVAYSGWIAFVAEDALMLRRDSGTMSVDSEWVARIHAVDTDRLREILPDADFYLPMDVQSNGGGRTGLPVA